MLIHWRKEPVGIYCSSRGRATRTRDILVRSGRNEGGEGGGCALAVALGLALGVCCAWTMKIARSAVFARAQRESVALRERYFRALYFAALLWIVFAGFLGAWASSLLCRLRVSQ